MRTSSRGEPPADCVGLLLRWLHATRVVCCRCSSLRKTLSVLVFAGLISPIGLFAQSWTHNGPWGACVTAVAMAPSDTNTLYAGTYGAGVWRSVDGGENWVQCVEGLPVWELTVQYNNFWQGGEQYPITGLWVHPNDENRVWVGVDGAGILASDNGGASWTAAGSGLPSNSKGMGFEFLSTSPDTLLAAMSGAIMTADSGLGGLYRSDDGGANWSLIESAPSGWRVKYATLVMDGQDSTHLFAGVWAHTTSLVESNDGGKTWETLSTDFISFNRIVIDPENAQYLWATVYTSFMEFLLVQSNDGGNTWFLYPSDEQPWLWAGLLKVDPLGNLYAGFGDSLVKSEDFGETWVPLATDVEDGIVDLIFNPHNPNSMFIGTGNGLYHSTDGGQTNEHSDTGIDNTYIQCIVPDPRDPDAFYAGGRFVEGDDWGGGFWKSEDRGSSWTRLADDAVNVIIFDPQHPDTMYRGGEQVLRSFDGGQTWEDIRGIMPGIMISFAVHPIQTNILYCGMHFYDPYFFRSEDYGNTWTYIDIDFLGSPHWITSLVIPMDASNEVYLAQSGVRKSEDTGLTWTRISAPGNLFDLVKQPHTNRFYTTVAALDAHDVAVSNDRAVHFSNLPHTDVTLPDSLMSFRCLYLNPDWTDQLFVSTMFDDVYYTEDLGQSWTALDGPFKRGYSIVSTANTEQVLVGTMGQGVFVADHMVSVGEPVSQSVLPLTSSIRSIYPNPFNDFVRISCELLVPQLVVIRVYNTEGQLVRTLANRQMTAGKHDLVWDAQNVASGTYFLLARMGGEVYNRKLTVIK